ncbi:hypothetical protein MPLDJ20_150212 [Mesorhizobium plurifarium]|uniref:Sarcosine oxidase subunit gamma n=1 Tax=Mesorhizobium plurifarium TaxID=69974 RepID=A0A090ENN8_MESPL|nr:hypothetical protein MPLDJ20_150212 [Mesorhizobium plurifarium]
MCGCSDVETRLERLRIDPAFGCSLSLGEGRMRLRLSGPRSFDILKACVAIDWDSPQAKPGSVLQTGFHHVLVLLLRTAADACDILAPHSFAQSLVSWVTDIAAPEIFEVK